MEHVPITVYGRDTYRTCIILSVSEVYTPSDLVLMISRLRPEWYILCALKLRNVGCFSDRNAIGTCDSTDDGMSNGSSGRQWHEHWYLLKTMYI